MPAGWRVWVDDGSDEASADAPLLASEDVPASGARVRRRIEKYPVTVMNPGIWSENQLEHEDFGFPAPPERRERPRLRLGVTIAVSALGLLIAAATVLLFIRLTSYATDSLPTASLAPAADVPAISAASAIPAGDDHVPAARSIPASADLEVATTA